MASIARTFQEVFLSCN